MKKVWDNTKFRFYFIKNEEDGHIENILDKHKLYWSTLTFMQKTFVELPLYRNNIEIHLDLFWGHPVLCSQRKFVLFEDLNQKFENVKNVFLLPNGKSDVYFLIKLRLNV